MEKFHNRGQGTLTAILTLMGLFLLVDIAIAVILIFNLKIPGLTNTASNTLKPVVTDNSSTFQTDNISDIP